jgi:hypothetical protein
MPHKKVTRGLIPALTICTIILSAASGCSNNKQSGENLIECGINLTPVSAEFVFLPEKNKLFLEVSADSIFIKRRNGRDSSLLDMRLEQSAVTRAVSDSLVCALRDVTPGSFVKKGVLDGSQITIRWAGKTVFCDNCLNDYVMQAAGNDFVVPAKRFKPLRDATQCLSQLDRIAEEVKPVNKLTTEVVVDPRRLTGATARYHVKKND